MVSVNIILFAIALFGTVIGTYTDIKTKLVPDWSNYFMLIAGLGGNAILSVLQSTYWPFIWSLVGAGAFFGVGYSLYVTGVWGGGDAKLLAAFGALFGSAGSVAAWPFLFSLWLNIMMFGAAFGIIGTFWIFAKNKDKVIPKIKEEFGKNKLIIYPVAGTVVVTSILYPLKAVFGIIAIISALILLVFVFRATESVCFFKKIKPSALVEGDWIAEPVSVADYNYNPKKSGVEKADIVKLIELEKEGKLAEVKVKDGLPYVPAFLAALIVTVFYGDIFYRILLSMV